MTAHKPLGLRIRVRVVDIAADLLIEFCCLPRRIRERWARR